MWQYSAGSLIIEIWKCWINSFIQRKLWTRRRTKRRVSIMWFKWWDDPYNMYAKSSEKLIFLTPWYPLLQTVQMIKKHSLWYFELKTIMLKRLLPFKIIASENVDFEYNLELFSFHRRVLLRSQVITFFIFSTTSFDSIVTSWVLAHQVEHIEYLLNLASFGYETWLTNRLSHSHFNLPTYLNQKSIMVSLWFFTLLKVCTVTIKNRKYHLKKISTCCTTILSKYLKDQFLITKMLKGCFR